MTETAASLRRKIRGARDLYSVVRAMKALASSNIVRCEQAVLALEGYAESVRLGLGLAWRAADRGRAATGSEKKAPLGLIVYGSDQGLVGRFNEEVVAHATRFVASQGREVAVWAMGERVFAALRQTGLEPVGLFAAPNTVEAISPLIGEILIQIETRLGFGQAEVHLMYNCHGGGACAPRHLRLLPLNAAALRRLGSQSWPTAVLPEVMGDPGRTVRALAREYVFVSLFRACAESLAGENASRLAAMQRAEKSIDELLVAMQGDFHRLCQAGIDAELFDVIAGFEMSRRAGRGNSARGARRHGQWPGRSGQAGRRKTMEKKWSEAGLPPGSRGAPCAGGRGAGPRIRV